MKTSKKKTVGIVLITILSIIVLIAASIGIYFGVLISNCNKSPVFDVSQTESQSGDVTVMTFNIRGNFFYTDLGDKSWYNRAENVVSQIADNAPDIIGFQEVQKSQQKFLSSHLVGYNSVLKYRDDAPFTEATPVYYRADKFNLISSDSFWLSETPDTMSKGWGAGNYRICSYAQLEEKATGKQFMVFNTHLDHKSDEARVGGIQLVLDKIAGAGSLPAMLMGDMNDKEGSVMYNKAVEDFLDTKYEASDTMDYITYNGWGARENTAESSPIDYIFMTKTGFDVESYKVLKNKVDGMYTSDHSPVVVKLKLI